MFFTVPSTIVMLPLMLLFIAVISPQAYIEVGIRLMVASYISGLDRAYVLYVHKTLVRQGECGIFV